MALDYVFITDSDSDLPYHLKEQYDIPVVYMPYALDGKEYFDDLGQTLDHKSYYDAMRAGASPVTSALNEASYLDYFEPILQEGKDILQKEADPPAGVLSREAEKRHLDRESFTGRLLSETLRLMDLKAEVNGALLGIMSNENVWTVLLQITNGSKELDDVLREEFNRLSNDPDVEGLLHRAMDIVDKLVEKAKDMDLTPIYDAFGQQAEEEGAE